MRPLLPVALSLSLLSPGLTAENPAPLLWSQLSLEACQVDTFAKAHPTWDGRGVVIAVLDTGVEVEAPGLQRLPDGSRKVLDVRDFTGDGDLYYSRVEPGPDAGTVIFRDTEQRPVVCRLPKDRQPVNGEWYGLWLDESHFREMGVEDVNDNGRTDDRVPVLLAPFQEPGSGAPVWRVAFDQNDDRDFGNERWMTDFWRAGDLVQLTRKAPEAQLPMLSLALNVYPAEHRLSLHYDNGGHGTHVAGIAAGHKLLDQPDFDGVAPGAWVISLKIGSNSKAGGSTTPGSKIEAFRYAARYAREHGVPVVCNLSYGISSLVSGQSDIDHALQQVLVENPDLIVVSSAGNSGPTLNTVGTPAAAPDAIAAAALLPAETARDTRGMPLPGHAVALFSSRGAELLKPDVITPGYATSSVTLFNRGGDVYQGTSMASPYAAGLCARLLSGAVQQFPGRPVYRMSLRRALADSGAAVPGTTVLDIGAGLPQLPRAWEALTQAIPQQRPEDPVTFNITTPSPMGRGAMPVALFRGLEVPRDPQVWTVQAVFPPLTDMALIDQFQQRFVISTDAPWLDPVEETVYLRGTQSAQVTVRYDATQLRTPGLHIGHVLLKAADRPGSALHQLELRSVVIVPERFDASRGQTWTATGTTPLAWGMDRRFLYVPPYASAVRFRLERNPALRKGVRVRALGPVLGDGRWTGLDLAKDDPRDRVEWTWSDVVGGVVEVPVYCPEGDAQVPWSLQAELIAIASVPAELSRSGGDSPRLEFALINQLEQSLQVQGSGVIDASRTTTQTTLGKDPRSQGYTRRITIPAGSPGLRVGVTMPIDGYLAFTDFAIGLYDTRGKALYKGGLDGPASSFTWTRSSTSSEQTVELRLEPAFTEYWVPREVPVSLDFDTLLAEPVSARVEVRGDGRGTIPLPAGLPVDVVASFGRLPGGKTTYVGRITLTDARRNDVLRTIPVTIGRE